jgi:hypothetical protein
VKRVILRQFLPCLDLRLGRHVHHDSESRRYAFPTAGLSIAAVRHQRHVPIFDQGQLGSCTGNAAVGCLATGPFYGTLTNPVYSEDEAGAVACYSAATRIDGYGGEYPPTDTGSDGLTVAKVLQQAGEIAGYQHTFSLDDALKALQTVPLITGVDWYADMFNPSSEGLLSVSGQYAGGHEIVVDEYDPVRGWVGFTNSWGAGWGAGGRFYLQAEDWGRLLAQQGDVTVFVPATQPAPQPTPEPGGQADAALAKAARPWVNQRHVGGNKVMANKLKAWLVDRGL